MKHSVDFVLAGTAHGPLIVNRNDFNKNPDGGIYGVGAQLFLNGSYEANEISLIQGILRDLVGARKRDVVAYDIGANIGIVALEMARTLGHAGRVVAYEPQEALFYALCGNVALNNLRNITVRNEAVGEFDGTIGVPKVDYAKQGSFGSLELRVRPRTEFIGQSVSYATRDLNKVPCVRLDSVVLTPAAFVKIDVEGMELDVLAGMQKILERDRPVLLVEFIKFGADRVAEALSPFYYDVRQEGLNLLCTPR